MSDSVRSLVLMAFAGSLGVMFLLLSCALPAFDNWTPFSVVVFYLLAPVPYLVARRRDQLTGGGDSGSNLDAGIFITTGLVLSGFALPFVLAHAPLAQPIIAWGACALATLGSLINFATIYGFFRVFEDNAFHLP